MPRWSYALGGLVAWTVHFSGVYAFASLEAVTAAGGVSIWRWASILLSIACAAGCVAVAHVAARRLRAGRDVARPLLDQVAMLGAGVALVAIIWQTLAVVIA